MSRACLLLAVLAALAAPVTAQTVINGDFEQPLDVGWKESTYSQAGIQSYDRWDTLGHPTYAARVYKYLASFASLSQNVTVPGPDYTLSLDARLRIGGGSSTCWPVAAFIVRYLDQNGIELGNTKFYMHSPYATWTSSDTAHLIDCNSVAGWQNYSLRIREELVQNLPGVSPDAVREVTLELHAYDSGT